MICSCIMKWLHIASELSTTGTLSLSFREDTTHLGRAVHLHLPHDKDNLRRRFIDYEHVGRSAITADPSRLGQLWVQGNDSTSFVRIPVNMLTGESEGTCPLVDASPFEVSSVREKVETSLISFTEKLNNSDVSTMRQKLESSWLSLPFKPFNLTPSLALDQSMQAFQSFLVSFQ